MQELIKDIIAKQLRLEDDIIDDDTDIIEDLGADSLDIVEMLMAIEENFGVTVPDEDIAELKTVRDIVDYVEKNM